MTSPSNLFESILQDFSQQVYSFKNCPIYVGFSGGVDSTLLLALACKVFGSEQVIAIHINHGLSELAGDWQEHCRKVCADLGCHLEVRQGSVVSQGQGLEAAARQYRYSQFKSILPSGAILLLGHHLDDQVETFFLRLMRGTGLHGLKAMARSLSRDQYTIIRPLLDVTKAELKILAAELAMPWVEDDSNTDTQLDRNYLRQLVLPLFEDRWPKYRERVQNVISMLDAPDEALAVLDMDAELKHRLSFDGGLKLVQMDKFTDDQTLSLIHAWLTSVGQLVPSKVRLKSIVECVIDAAPDRTPEVQLGDGFIRRHGPALYWVKTMVEPSDPPLICFNETIYWKGVGQLELRQTANGSNRIKLGLPDLHWRLRQGGEMMRPQGRAKTRDLKRLMQEYRIKPWLRDRIPLLFSGDQLVAVGNEMVSEDHCVQSEDVGLEVIWQNSEIPD